MKYYLSHQGTQLGPWSAEEILSKVQERFLSWTDYLFDESSKEWILLMEHPIFAGSFRSSAQPKVIEKESTIVKDPHIMEVSVENEKEWFVLKGENKYGPFNFLELLKMLQEKGLYEYDFVWNSSMPQWARVAELEEFRPDRIKTLHAADKMGIKEAFFRRRYVRVAYNTSLLVHNSKSVWKGSGIEIGPGGAGILIDCTDFEPGQTLFLHFKAGDGVPPFNAICSIVSKQFVEGQAKPVRYGVKFTSISHSIQKAIKAFTDRQAS